MPVEITQVLSAEVAYILTAMAGIGVLVIAKKPRQAIAAALVLLGTLLTKVGLAMGAEPPKVK